MRKFYAIIVAIVSICAFVVLTGFSDKEDSAKAQNEIVNTVKVDKTTETKSGSKNLIKFTLDPKNPVLHLSSPQIRDIDVDALKKEIGKDNVGIDYDNNQLHLNVKDKVDNAGMGEFYLETDHGSKVILEISDINESQLLLTVLNPKGQDASLALSDEQNSSRKKDKDNEDDEDDLAGEDGDDGVGEDPNIHEDEDKPFSGWMRSDRMMVTPGHFKNNPDGTADMPVMYFGALNYALKGLTIKKSVAGRPQRKGLLSLGVLLTTPIGDGRMNNVTAANSGVISVGKGSNLNVEQNNDKKEKNHFYTNTFGDGMLPPPSVWSGGTYKAGDKVYRGSQRNFVTTNIFDYTKPSGDITRPNLIGPDLKNFGDYTGLVKKQTRLYHKIYEDPHTKEQTTMQRLIFYQKIGDYQIRVKITMRFDRNNKLIINQEFTNVSTKYIDNFQGYVFRDITFMKDHTLKQSSQANVIRSLGDHKGIYAQSAKWGSKLEMELNGFEDSPYAWAGRGSKSSFFENTDTDHFPYSYSGDFKKPNAFKDVNDVGDKDEEPGYGKTWIDENVSYDGGISMHTKNQPLPPGQTVTLSYTTKAELTTADPELELDQPYQLQPEDKSYKVSGHWLSSGSNEVMIKYLVRPLDDTSSEFNDTKDKLELQKNGITVGNKYNKQNLMQMNSGYPHPWSTDIGLDQLQPGVNEFYAIAIDRKGRTSEVKRLKIILPDRDDPLTIGIQQPVPWADKYHPYEPRIDKTFNGKLNFKGFANSDSKHFQIHYGVDTDDPKELLKEEKNYSSKETYFWERKGLSVKQFMNDTNPHKVIFSLTSFDDTGNVKGVATAEFWFQMKPHDENEETDEDAKDGHIQVIPPKLISFGKLNLSDNGEKDVKSKFNGNFFVDDYRQDDKRSNPIHIKLETTEFKSEDNSLLNTQVFWNKSDVSTSGTYDINGDKLAPRMDVTNIVKKNLHLKVKRSQNIKDDSFKSKFYWNVVDSC